jgi:hypothetical protein
MKGIFHLSNFYLILEAFAMSHTDMPPSTLVESISTFAVLDENPDSADPMLPSSHHSPRTTLVRLGRNLPG